MEMSHPGAHGKQSGPLLKVLESHKRVGKRIFEVYKDMDELMRGNAFILLGEAPSVCEGTREDGPFLLNSIGGPEECTEVVAAAGGWGLLARRQQVPQRNQDRKAASTPGVSIIQPITAGEETNIKHILSQTKVSR